MRRNSALSSLILEPITFISFGIPPLSVASADVPERPERLELLGRELDRTRAGEELREILVCLSS